MIRPHEQEPLETQNIDDVENDEEEESLSVTQWIIGWLWFLFKLGFALTVIAIIVVTGAVIGIVKGFSEQIPIVSDRSYRPNLTTQLFDCKGRSLASLHAEENRTRILAANEIPDKMRQAVISIEDERFYQLARDVRDGKASGISAALRPVLAQALVAAIECLARGRRREGLVNPERASQLHVRPVIERVAKRVRDRPRPRLELLPVGGIPGAEPLGHAVRPHRPPLVVIALEPDLRDRAESMVGRHLLRREMAVEIDDGQLLGHAMIQVGRHIVLEQKVGVQEWSHAGDSTSTRACPTRCRHTT